MRAAVCLVVFLAGCSAPPPYQEPVPVRLPPKILHFYASSGAVAPGEAFQICYGVENATSVRLEPPIDQIRPSFNRCIPASIRRATTFTLTAQGSDGSTKAVSFQVNVDRGRSTEPAAPASSLITLFASSADEVARGEMVTLCYGLAGAQSARIDPQPGVVEMRDKNCVRVGAVRTTTYTLTATSTDGSTEKQQVTVRVRP